MNTRTLYLLAVLATVSSVCVWKAVWNLLEIYLLPYTAWSEVICGVCGLVGLWGTSSLINSAGVVDQTSRDWGETMRPPPGGPPWGKGPFGEGGPQGVPPGVPPGGSPPGSPLGSPPWGGGTPQGLYYK